MRRKTVWLLPLGIIVGIMLSGFFRRPAPEPGPDEVQTLDGAGTYTDNDAFWRVLMGRWESEDGWTLDFHGEESVTILREGEPVGESALRFAYLLPSPPAGTELEPEAPALTGPDGAALGEVLSLLHDAGTETVTLTLQAPDGEETVLVFHKLQEEET